AALRHDIRDERCRRSAGGTPAVRVGARRVFSGALAVLPALTELRLSVRGAGLAGLPTTALGRGRRPLLLVERLLGLLFPEPELLPRPGEDHLEEPLRAVVVLFLPAAPRRPVTHEAADGRVPGRALEPEDEPGVELVVRREGRRGLGFFSLALG